MRKLSVLTLSLILGLAAIAAVLTVYVPQAIAAEIHVYPGESIQAAIDDPSTIDGDTIIVYEGTYYENIHFGSPSKAITVKSTNPDDQDVVKKTIIDGDGKSTVVTFYGGLSGPKLEGFTLTHGSSTNGGGVYCAKYQTQVSLPKITDCIITGNGATNGGGICCAQSCNPIITKCTISDNTANNGGGIYCNQSSPTITQCDISKNIATATTGDNGGGGIYCRSTSKPEIINCTITGNQSYRYGGGIYTYLGPGINIINCTFSGNSAGDKGYGGGIYCQQGKTTITNCIFYYNTNGDIKSSSTIFVVNYSDVQEGRLGTGNLDPPIDPLFRAPSEGDYRIQQASPCIDRGTDVDAPAYDKDGVTRPQDGDGDGTVVSDMGAYEYVFDQPPTLVRLDQFSAEDRGNHIVITWTTLSETDTAGFNLWRAQTEGGEYVKINPAIIESEGGPALNAPYIYDDMASPVGAYYYQLEEIDNSGMSIFYGPVSPAIQPSSSRPVENYSLGYEQLESLESMLWLSITQHPYDYLSFYSQLWWYPLK